MAESLVKAALATAMAGRQDAVMDAMAADDSSPYGYSEWAKNALVEAVCFVHLNAFGKKSSTQLMTTILDFIESTLTDIEMTNIMRDVREKFTI